MEVYKPKPIHGFREFIKEIGSIVLGVGIALAAEQGVEWWHWQHELHETRQALKTELARAVGAYQYDVALQNCSDRRLKELAKWLDHSQPGERLPAVRPIGVPMGYTLLLGTWDVAKSGQAAWRMPLEERLRFSHLYGSLSRFYDIVLQNNQVWDRLAQFDGAEPLDHADRMTLRGAVSEGLTLDQTMRTFDPFIMPDVAALGFTPQKRSARELDADRSFCEPLLSR